MSHLLGEMLSFIEGHVVLRGVEVVKDLEAGLPLFYGQCTKLEQVFFNMVVNAAEAIEGRGVLLATRLGRQTGFGRVLVSFKDDGPGVLEDVPCHVFEPFFTTKAMGGASA
ncbi:hypothetical protein DFAR_3540003 [Desulfarculales bacterium]